MLCFEHPGFNPANAGKSNTRAFYPIMAHTAAATVKSARPFCACIEGTCRGWDWTRPWPRSSVKAVVAVLAGCGVAPPEDNASIGYAIFPAHAGLFPTALGGRGRSLSPLMRGYRGCLCGCA